MTRGYDVPATNLAQPPVLLHLPLEAQLLLTEDFVEAHTVAISLGVRQHAIAVEEDGNIARRHRRRRTGPPFRVRGHMQGREGVKERGKHGTISDLLFVSSPMLFVVTSIYSQGFDFHTCSPTP